MKKIPVRQESIETMFTAEEICLGVAANAEDNVSAVNVVDNVAQVVLGEGTNGGSATGPGECTLEKFKNPDIGASKGQPKNVTKGRRLVPIAEQKRTKKQITCSNCGSHEHNKATCTAPPKDRSAQKNKAPKKMQNKKSGIIEKDSEYTIICTKLVKSVLKKILWFCFQA
jgi:hypothetical protein